MGHLSSRFNIFIAIVFSLFSSAVFNYEVYDGAFLQLSDFYDLTPRETGTSKVIQYDIANQPTNFGLVFTNQQTVDTAATYEFSTTADDGLMSNADFNAGDTVESLGDAKAGES